MPTESQICRTCLESKSIDEMISVFFKSLDEESLATMLKCFTSTKVEKNDGLPYFICSPCAKNIKISYLFKQQCEDSYEKLIRCMQETFNHEDSITTSSTEKLSHHIIDLDLPESPPQVPLNLEQNNLPDNVDEIMFDEAIDEYSECSFTEISSSPVQDVEIHEMLNFCHICEKTFETAEQLSTHAREECRGPHKCFKCGKSFKRAPYLRRHEKTHLDIKPFKCDECDKRYVRKDHLKAHFLKCHKTLHRKKTVQNIFTETPLIPFELKDCRVVLNKMPSISAEDVEIHEMLHSCNICKKTFETPELIAQHVCEDCLVPAITPHVAFENINQEDEVTKSEAIDKYAECSFIEISSSPVQDVEISEMLHFCHICEETFETAEQLSIHAREDCRGPHKCFKCGKSFKRNSQLRRHEKTHSDIKPFKCSICEKRFKQKHSLQVHEASVHLDIIPFECNQCEKRFNRKFLLKNHILKHHSFKAWEK